MKRILFAVMAVSACVVMTGCNREDDEDAIEKANDAEFRKMPPHEKDLGEFKEEVTFSDNESADAKRPAQGPAKTEK